MNDESVTNWDIGADGVRCTTESSMIATGTRFNHLQCLTDVVCPVALWQVRYKLSFRDLPEMFLERDMGFTHEAVREREAQLPPWAARRCASPDGEELAAAGM